MTKMSELLRDAREKSGFTQTELAFRIGMPSGQFISNIERSVSSLPVKHFRLASKVLGVSVKRFVRAAAMDFEIKLIREALKNSRKRAA